MPNLGACEGPVARHFAHPRGRIGGLVGHLMARKNRVMNERAVEALRVRPDDLVVELGFGHGATLARLVERAHRGLVAGVDPSAAMVAQASSRNQTMVDGGRVELHRGYAEDLPFPDELFTRALAVNGFQFWHDQRAGLVEAHRVLRPGGLLVLALRVAHPTRQRFVAPGFRLDEVDAAADLARGAGFDDVTVEVGEASGRDLRFVSAWRGAGA